MKRPNLVVRTGVHVTGIVLDGRRATGVATARAVAAAPSEALLVGSEVILSGGAYNSPQVLQQSGIGPPACSGRSASRCATRSPASART